MTQLDKIVTDAKTVADGKKQGCITFRRVAASHLNNGRTAKAVFLREINRTLW